MFSNIVEHKYNGNSPNSANRQAVCLCVKFNFGAVLAKMCSTWGEVKNRWQCMRLFSGSQVLTLPSYSQRERGEKPMKVVYSTHPSQPILIQTTFLHVCAGFWGDYWCSRRKCLREHFIQLSVWENIASISPQPQAIKASSEFCIL